MKVKVNPQHLEEMRPLSQLTGPVDAIGIDSGASLVKMCARDHEGGLFFETWPAPAVDLACEILVARQPRCIGVTGCGAQTIADRSGELASVRLAAEFDAWGAGARALLETIGHDASAPFLLVSIGTGTSALRVEGDQVERVGGSSLGGGTALGLGRALANCVSHEELTALAARGRRGGVDLLISDLYDTSEHPMVGEATAASFGKLAAQHDLEPPAREDMAAAVVGLVAENVGLMSNALATSVGVKTIVYGGSTLLENPSLVGTIAILSQMLGHEAVMLPCCGHAGALGALLLSD